MMPGTHDCVGWLQELRQQETKIISDLHKAQTDSHAVQQASTTDNRRIENENGRIAQDKEDLTAKEDILRKNAGQTPTCASVLFTPVRVLTWACDGTSGHGGA